MVAETLAKRATGDGESRARRHLRRLGTMVRRSLPVTEREGEPIPDGMAATGAVVRLPQWLFMALLGWLFAGTWWAATLSSDLRHEIADRAARDAARDEIVEVQRLRIDNLREKLAERGWNPPDIQIRAHRREEEK